MWVWMRTRQDRLTDKRWQIIKVAGFYALGLLLIVFGIAVLRGQ